MQPKSLGWEPGARNQAMRSPWRSEARGLACRFLPHLLQFRAVSVTPGPPWTPDPRLCLQLHAASPCPCIRTSVHKDGLTVGCVPNRSVLPSSFLPHGPWSSRRLCPWDSPGRILSWLGTPFSRGSSPPRGPAFIVCFGRQLLYRRATWGASVWVMTALTASP